jgi:hypothetical protein
MKGRNIKTTGFLILKFLLLALVCSCSSSRYTSFKSFVSGPPYSKVKVEKDRVTEDIELTGNIKFFETNETAQLAPTNDYYVKRESPPMGSNVQQKNIKPKVQKKENKLNREIRENDYYKKRRKPFRLMEYDESGLKYNKLFASIAISTGFMWIAGFFLAGVGTVMFFFFGASVISGLLSLIKRR